MTDSVARPADARMCCNKVMVRTDFPDACIVKHECLVCSRTLQREKVNGYRHDGEYRARSKAGTPVSA